MDGRGTVEQFCNESFLPWDEGRLGSPRPWFGWEEREHGEILVQHPIMTFDPASSVTRNIDLLRGGGWADTSDTDSSVGSRLAADCPLILHRGYELAADFPWFLNEFQACFEDASGVPPDAFLWMDTGAWMAKTQRMHLIGLGNSTLEKAFHIRRPKVAAYVLIATSSIIAFLYDHGIVKMEVCFGNRFIPFAEEIWALEKALNGVCRWQRHFSRMEVRSDLYRPPPAEPTHRIRVRAVDDDEEHQDSFRLHPVAVLKAEGEPDLPPQYHLGVFRRPRTQIPYRVLRRIPYVLAQSRTNWVDDDFSYRFVNAGTEVIFLDSLAVVAWLFDTYSPPTWQDLKSVSPALKHRISARLGHCVD